MTAAALRHCHLLELAGHLGGARAAADRMAATRAGEHDRALAEGLRALERDARDACTRELACCEYGCQRITGHDSPHGAL